MKSPILIAGGSEFTKKVNNRLDSKTILTKSITIEEQTVPSLYINKIEQAKVVFINSQPNLIPIAHYALKKSKNVVLFGIENCELKTLNELLELAIESKSFIVNGDSLLFNPVIFPMIDSLKRTEFTSLTSNRFRKSLSRRQIFNCIEFLIASNPSAVKKIFSKGVRLNNQKINMLHVRFEFEDDSLCVLELSNNKQEPKLYVESAGSGNWMALDLLSFNGRYFHYSDDKDEKVNPPKQIFPKERNAIHLIVKYIDENLEKLLHPHQQFEHAIETAKAIQVIEEQLRRGLPNFVKFNGK